MDLSLQNIVSVYSGRPGCACGCRGTHKVASAHVAFRNQKRTRPVSDDEISDISVKRIFKRVMSYPLTRSKKPPMYHRIVGDNNVSVETPTRLLIIYPKMEKK